jgi:S-formylglutathione hydrolase FrmB
MKYLFSILLAFLSSMGFSQKGSVQTFTLNSKALINKGGENPNRSCSVYLPPGYEKSSDRYPVIYFLHGFTATDKIADEIKDVLDEGILRKKIRPYILVIPNHYTLFQGSFYTDSELTGNWETFTYKELVEHMDKNFRTLPVRESRGIAGHSMGGYGAIKIAMRHPEVFSSVYGLSPGLMSFVKEFGPNSPFFKIFQNAKNEDDLNRAYYPKVLAAVGRAWSPNPNKPPFFCDMPFSYKADSLIVNEDVLKKWHANMPVEMVNDYADNLRKLTAIKLDWGRNDSPRFPVQNMAFSQKLENIGVNHFAEEYIGTHVDKIWTLDGRVLNSVLPFFNDYLKF